MNVRGAAFLLLLCGARSIAQEVYVSVTGPTVRIGNDAVERVISTDPASPGTTAILNKLSGELWPVRSEEFALSVVVAGFGPAPGKEQNGENPATLTARVFQLTGVEQGHEPDGTRTLLMRYGLDLHGSRLRVTVRYTAAPGELCMRKEVEVSDSAGSMHFLDRIAVEDLAFEAAEWTRGAFGQPVFVGDIFLGVEYPGVENSMEQGRLRPGYPVGVQLGPVPFRSARGVLGVARSARHLERAFLRYVETIKVRGTRPFLLYNTWYDIRHPTRVADPAHGMTEQIVLERVRAFRKHMKEPHGITLDAFVLDDGWDNVESIWRIDSTTFPRGFTPVANALKEMGTAPGLWASPFCGYDMRDRRVRWGAAHGYEHTGDFLCFAGERYGREFRERMVRDTRDYGVGYFNWDGFLLACNEPDHGHLPGVYSRRALIRTFAEMMEAVRQVNPDIFINITVGTWLSPWWLLYADCVWMQGEDYAYAEDVPSLNPRDKAITYRDAVLWGNFGKQDLLFPVSSMMTHGIIKGRLNMLGGREESFESFTNEVVMYFGRGVMMWELYVSPEVLSREEWQTIASCVNWGRRRRRILTDTRMIGGNPLKREPYGYVHSDGTRGIVVMRNPSVHRARLGFSLESDLEFDGTGRVWRAARVYPYRSLSDRTYRYRDTVNLDLAGYEVAVVDIVPDSEIVRGTPLGVRYTDVGDTVKVFGPSATERNVHVVGGASPVRVRFDGSAQIAEVKRDRLSTTVTGASVISATVTVPEGRNDVVYALLLEPARRLEGGNPLTVAATADGAAVRWKIEQEGGKWFWVLVPMKPGVHRLEVSLSAASPLSGRAETWLFEEVPLGSAVLSVAGAPAPPSPLPLPYPSTVEKRSRRLGEYALNPGGRP